MKILAIDTSCDDTCIAIIKGKGQKAKGKSFVILSNIVSSQVKIHQKYGGVYPSLAKREHQRNLIPVLKKSLKEANLLSLSVSDTDRQLKKILEREEILYKQLKKFLEKYQKPKINAIAVTIGPGLEPCLWVGVNFARALSYYWNLPIIPINHIESHILANFLNNKFQVSSFKFQELFPAVCLVVSGGHTQLILMKKIGEYKILGETRDDAAGECFDKTARILGLDYPGGPAIATEAAEPKSEILNLKSEIKLPRPMIHSKDYDFSFSGLKTAVLYNFKTQPLKIQKNKQYIKEMCREIQQAVIDVLIKKTIKAAKDYSAKTIMLGGGVAANNELRKQFIENCKLKIVNCNFLVPPKNLCTDNAAMIAITAYFHKNQVKNWSRWRSHRGSSTKSGQKIKANANLRIN